MQLKKIIVLFVLISLCLSSQATFIPLTVQEINGSPSVSKVKNITFNGATLTDLLNGRVLVTVAPGTTAAGSSGNIQFNNSGAFASSSNLTWNNGTNTLLVNGAVNANYFRTPNKTAATSLLAYRIYDEYGFAHGLGLDANNQLYTSSSLGINGSPPGGHRFSVNGLTSIRLGTGDYFGVGDANDGFAAFKIIPTSNYVGIGTQNPSERLEVLGNAKINGKLTANGTNASAVVLTTKGASGQTANIQEWKTSNNLTTLAVDNAGTLNAFGGALPKMKFRGDGTSFFGYGSGIQFDGVQNYFFGIGRNLSNPAILIQSNDAVFINNLNAGYIGAFGGATADSWGRTEGNKGRFTFGTGGGNIITAHGGTTADYSTYLSMFKIESPRAALKTFIIQGKNGQTANLTEWQNANGTTLSVINSSGNIGAKISNPIRPLHISQAMRLEPLSGSQPTSPSMGDIYMDGDTGSLCLYDGSTWSPLGGGTNTCN